MNRRIALGFIVAMVLIASGFIISFYSYNQYSEDTKRVRHTYEVTGTLEKILSLLKDVETGSRDTPSPMMYRIWNLIRLHSAYYPNKSTSYDYLATTIEFRFNDDFLWRN
ncbi:hypothetical protein [Spirosoma telluris]|uniref:CHASE3 domain-containing protein n=1 Tax=Spirosoma telluris TaxID=2183553 RepID=UPI002FC32090